MKIIFLDIDGVLNSLEYRKRLGLEYYSDMIDSRKMPLLKRIVEETGARIVLSTSWRKYWNPGDRQTDPAGAYIHRVFTQFNLAVYDKIPVLDNSDRGSEISAWLADRPYVDGYVILDDKDLGWTPALRAHFVQTDLAGDGLEEAQAKLAEAVLRGELLPVEEREKSILKNWLKRFRK